MPSEMPVLRPRQLLSRAALAIALSCPLAQAAGPPVPRVDLRENLVPSPVRDPAAGSIVISGKTEAADGRPVRVRVTTSLGDSNEALPKAKGGRFACRYPQDFVGALPLSPALLYVDATDAAELSGQDLLVHQAEALLIVSGKTRREVPDLPLVFLDDFIDGSGRKDAASAQWRQRRNLANVFMHSRGASLMRIAQPDFDLANGADYAWFKDRASLYDFDHRDRDWSRPLGHRVARGFWQAEWNSWFNHSNDHPWDGNPENREAANYRPYTFTNDLADLLVLYQLRRTLPHVALDNRDALAGEVLENLLALQYRGAGNFALLEASGKQEHYTAGAFRYGMFDTGQWLTEGTGWFANSKFRDFVRGGVFNGRAVWALGESLRAQPTGPLAVQVRDAITLALRFCLHDGLEHHYTRLTEAGYPVWGGVAGEHGYLLLGMLAAASVAPELPIVLAHDQPARPLRDVCAEALDALVEIRLPDGTWSHYANVDATNITALAEGSGVLAAAAHAERWRAAAVKAADVWISLQPLAEERTAPTPLLGHRKGAGLTYYLGKEDHPHV
ncbi:MAG TPA: hypothetical protein VHY20_08405, partial [Pirellulales bacterium]|nr:hypothetical protein [Pirellulales bacterium]